MKGVGGRVMIGVMARKKGELGPAPSLSRTEEEWEEIIFQRIAELESGAVKAIPADEAIARIRAKLRRLRGGH